MKNFFLALCTIAAIILVIVIVKPRHSEVTDGSQFSSSNSTTTMSIAPTTGATLLKLSSIVFSDGGMIPDLYTCKGQDVNPPLDISGVPEGTKTLALTMEDPDTSIGNFDHWVVFDIPATTTNIPAASEPSGVHGITSSGDLHYIGPCPPSGVHRYVFTLYALDTELGLKEGSKKDKVLTAMKGHVIGMAKLIGMFGK